jgi:hypothetical protein
VLGNCRLTPGLDRGKYSPRALPEKVGPNFEDEDEIQEIESVDSHNSQSSKGQLRKPTEVVRVDVTATPFINDEVNARSDDLLALKAENQLELDLSGKAEVKPCPNVELGSDFVVRKSDTLPNCHLVRPVNPEPSPDSPALLKFKERQREMAEIKHFLERDFRFSGLESGLMGLPSGPCPDIEIIILRKTNLFLNQDVVQSINSSPFGMNMIRMK